MMRYGSLIALLCIATACGSGGPSTDQEMTKWMSSYEDSLKKSGQQPDQFREVKQISERYIAGLLLYAENYPKAEKTAECLDKAHMMLTGIGKNEEAAKWGEKIITDFPDYVNRPMVLESVASAYDISIQPRDSVKVRRYYELLLNENPAMEAEKKDGIQRRLLMNHLPFDRYLELMILNNPENQ